MPKSTLQALPKPVVATNLLHDFLRAGAQQLIASAVEAAPEVMLSQHANRQPEDGRQAVGTQLISA